MKKKFISILLVVSIICMSLTYTMEEQVKGGVSFGNRAVCSWQAQGLIGFCKSVEKKFHIKDLNTEKESVIFSLPEGGITVQISDDGRLKIIGNSQE